TFLSDNGNFILDCYFDQISDPGQTEVEINRIPGVVENGLFVGRVDRVIVGTADGIQTQDPQV
ncbi:TPA: ribose 5-phosphate isomerase A, partial [Candidatus Poribacteria bacterium]|nr:ribose 5-phosphate isomerase A [Candidatus Poribacteria bacterium]